MKVKLCLLLSAIYIVNVLAADVGDQCRLENDKNGVCQLVTNCEYAKQLLKLNSKPQLCGFSRNVAIVCCLEVEEVLSRISKSEKACQQYKTTHPKRIPVFAIAGGDAAIPNEFPHMAALGYGDRPSVTYNCGGSLISEKFVMTAAHCISNRDLGKVRWVRLGDHDLNNAIDDGVVQELPVRETYIHPEYRLPVRYNDIALIRLDGEVQITLKVKPACLYTEYELPRGIPTATGWGATSHGGDLSNILLKVNLDFVENSACRQAYATVGTRNLPEGIMDRYQICAGRFAGKDTCQGDSGGPLQTYDRENDTYYIVGLTSFGKPCALTKSPGVYTRVSNYVDWIESIVWPDSDTCALKNGVQGVCKVIHLCFYAQQLLKERKRPEICGYDRYDPIVCCLNEKPKLSQKVCQRYKHKTQSSLKKIDEEDDGFVHITVAGGKKARKSEFPHMAALGYGDRNNIQYNCGGSLITESFVLTAAHCTNSRDLGRVRWVRLGDQNLNDPKDDTTVQDFSVASVHIHPNYAFPLHYHDIALLKLDRPASINNGVKPACLYSDRRLPEEVPTVTGWGATSHAGDQSSFLMKASLNLIDFDSCQSAYRSSNAALKRRLPNGIIDDYQICAGNTTGIDTCQGDSGGPLQILDKQTSTFYILGITSFGKPCAVTNSPGVYTRVSNYIDWIQSIVGPIY